MVFRGNKPLMNDKSLNSILLGAIVVTILLVVGVHFIPEKRMALISNPSIPLFLNSEKLPDGTPSSEWTNEQHSGWQCNYPDNFDGNYFPCGITMDLSSAI